MELILVFALIFSAVAGIVCVVAQDVPKYPKAHKTASQCPGKPWIQFGNNCYLAEERDKATLNSSESFCKKLGADMPSIHSEEEMRFLIVEFDITKRYWIGLRKYQNGTYYWTDGTPVNYLKWGYSDPDQLSENYWGAVIYHGDIWDEPGNVYHYPMCKFQLANNSTRNKYVLPDTLDKIIEKLDMNTLNISSIADQVIAFEKRLSNFTSEVEALKQSFSNVFAEIEKLAETLNNKTSDFSDRNVTLTSTDQPEKQSQVQPKETQVFEESGWGFVRLIGIIVCVSIITNIVCYLILVRTRVKKVIFKYNKMDDKVNIVDK